MEAVGMRRTIVAVALIVILVMMSTTAFAQTKKAPEKAKDPVCGIMVDKDPKLSANHKGETYYFCSKADMEKFKKEPEKYVRKK
jgi:YHS domain-containing protein